MERPDLTYLTQAEFEIKLDLINKDVTLILDQNDDVVFISGNCEPEMKYLLAISKLPGLVQCAEMLFDMTLDKPNSIIHKMVSDLLNELKEEK